MSQERISMNKLRDVLRLHFECKLSNRSIARALNISATTVGNYISSAQESKLLWSEIATIGDQDLMQHLEHNCKQIKTKTLKQQINFVHIHAELKRKGITRELLHEEYLSASPSNPISYSEFCRQYRIFKKTLKPSMRQNHVAGERTFVDYAGPTVPIHNAHTGGVQCAMIFVGVLGASNFTFAEATFTRSLPDWIGSHVRMFNYFGGVTELIIPDNEKSGVTKACYYDPEVNPNYTALAAHYGTAVMPARPYHPKDKAKAEVGVQVVERWILAKLRHQKFFSLIELNQEIAKLLEELNDKPFKKLPGNRRSAYEELDKPALKCLPKIKYEYKVIKKAQVNLDYHVEVAKHYYSVPHHYIGKCVEYQLAENSVAFFCQGQRIAYHIRSNNVGQATTLTEHMPHAHLQHQQWTPQKFVSWSETVGIHTTTIAKYLIKHKPNPECCYRINLGFLNLAKKFGKSRLEEACKHAASHQLQSYTQIKSILETQSDKAPIAAANDNDADQQTPPVCQHKNLRGATYYSFTKGKL